MILNLILLSALTSFTFHDSMTGRHNGTQKTYQKSHVTHLRYISSEFENFQWKYIMLVLWLPHNREGACMGLGLPHLKKPFVDMGEPLRLVFCHLELIC